MLAIGADVNDNIDTSSILEATAITTTVTESNRKKTSSRTTTGTEEHIKTGVSTNIIKDNDFNNFINFIDNNIINGCTVALDIAFVIYKLFTLSLFTFIVYAYSFTIVM